MSAADISTGYSQDFHSMFGFKRVDVAKDLENRIERLEASFKRLEIDWTDVYDKFRRLHMRVAKQAQRAEQAQEQESVAGADGGGEAAEASSLALTDRQQRIQALILARRARMRGVQ